MQISSNFNRLIHGVILSKINKIRLLKTSLGDKEVEFKPFYFSKDTLKQFLKLIDLDYPRDKNGLPLSYTKLNNLEMLNHYRFLELLLIENGYEDLIDENS